MIWGKTSRKTVFILGAGATRGAFSHVIVHGKRIKAPLNGDFFKVAERFVKAKKGKGFLRRYERLRTVFQEEFPTRGRWPIPMEEAFSLLYVSKDFPSIYSRRGPRRKAGTRREIEDFLRLTYGILGTIESRVQDGNLYQHLVDHLEREDVIITLNYDTLLDAALIRSGWDPQQGYSLIGGSRKFAREGKKIAIAERLRGVKLLKLHGSLNWYVKGSFENLSKVFDSKPSRIIISDKPRTNESKSYMRQIVPPVYGKFFGHKHWEHLWGTAYKALTEAEAIVVIGCSLVDTDFHLSGMVSHAVKIRKQKHNRFDVAAFVDKTRIRRKWQRVLRGCTPTKNGNFSSFAKFSKNVFRRLL